MSGTVVDRIRSAADRAATNVAVVDGARSSSFAELFDRTDRLSAAFHALGLRPFDRVLAFLPNALEAMECELAVLQSGLVWITLTSRLTWAEVRSVLVSCVPKLLVTDAAGLARINDGRAEIPAPRMPPIVVTGSTSGGGENVVGYEDLVSSHDPIRPTVHVGAEHPARLRYTSGTMGTMGSAKAAVLPHRVYHASLDNLRVELGPFGPGDRALHVAPLTHGSGALVYPILEAGGANVLERQFDVDGVLSSIERLRITTMFTVPTMLSRLVATPRFTDYDLSSLRALIYGGAPMPEAQLEVAVKHIGRALVHIYGMTEAPWPIAALRQSEHHIGNPRLRSIGKATSICEVGIVGEDGAALGPGQVGEIRIRGRNVMSGYLDDDESTRAVLREGWLASGDLGKIDEAGYVFIVGRKGSTSTRPKSRRCCRRTMPCSKRPSSACRTTIGASSSRRSSYRSPARTSRARRSTRSREAASRRTSVPGGSRSFRTFRKIRAGRFRRARLSPVPWLGHLSQPARARSPY
jgi:acyl-CoA synthetase (AMP-forming)/AMP-acid ligase II